MNKMIMFIISVYPVLNKILLPVFLSIMLLIVSSNYSSDIQASSHKTDQKQNSKAPLIRQKIYQKLSTAQQLVQNKKYREATDILDQIKDDRRLNSTELAQLWNFYAFIYFSQDLYPQAIEAYETLLAQPELQAGIKTSTLYTLSQLNFMTENYAQALARIQQWIALSEQPSADAYALLGQAYYKLEQFKNAISSLNTAIAVSRTSGKMVKENWYLLLRASHYELKDYKSMAFVLKELVSIYPKPQYFKDLAGAYSQLGDTTKQLAIMETMYEKGQLNRATEIKNLASLLLIHEVPYKAAKIIDKAITDGILKKTAKNYELLSQSWIQAREDKRAIEPLTKAARLSDQGEPWIKLSRAYINLDQWPQAVQSLEHGLQKKGVKQADSSYILLGMSYYNLKQLKKAMQAFSKAQQISKNKHNKNTASQWIKYLQTEIQRAASS